MTNTIKELRAVYIAAEAQRVATQCADAAAAYREAYAVDAAADAARLAYQATREAEKGGKP